MADILVITVNYKGADATAAFLESAEKLEQSERARLLIVENGSQDGSAEKLRPLIANVTNAELLELPQNLGYFGGANWALQHYLAKEPLPNWVIVCNNDIIFEDHQFLSKLFRKDPERVGVIAPAIVARLTGADCNPFMRCRPTRLPLLRIRMWHSSYYLMWAKQFLSPYIRRVTHRIRPHLSALRPDYSSEIYGPHGAMFIFSRSYFDAGGYLDVGHFLYAEELCVAEICLKLHLRVVHDRELCVLHNAHHATGRRLNRAMYEHARGALSYFLRKYYWAKDRPAPQIQAIHGFNSAERKSGAVKTKDNAIQH